MKWGPLNGSVQKTIDERYSVVRATQEPEMWLSYEISPFKNAGQEIGIPSSCAEDARQVCEDYEALRKRA